MHGSQKVYVIYVCTGAQCMVVKIYYWDKINFNIHALCRLEYNIMGIEVLLVVATKSIIPLFP